MTFDGAILKQKVFKTIEWFDVVNLIHLLQGFPNPVLLAAN